MENFRYIRPEFYDEACYVRLRKFRLDEPEVYRLAEELITLITRDGCRQLALSLGPEPPSCLYSVFMAKLVTVQRLASEYGGELVLVEVGPEARSVFEACSLEENFTFLPTLQAALERWKR